MMRQRFNRRMSQARFEGWERLSFMLRHPHGGGVLTSARARGRRQASRDRVTYDFSEMLAVSNQAEATQRSTMSASHQRVTLRVRFCTPLCGLSMTLVVARPLYSEGGNCNYPEGCRRHSWNSRIGSSERRLIEQLPQLRETNRPATRAQSSSNTNLAAHRPY